MQIMIDIPKKFENHFNSDKFEDSLQRVRFDIHKSIIGNKDVLSRNYEIEILDMLTEAFLKGLILPKGHGRLIDESKADGIIAEGKDGDKAYFGTLNKDWEVIDFLKTVPTVIEAESEEKK